MKKLLSLAIAALLSLTALADDYNLYVVTPTATTTYELSNVRKITFEGANVVVTTTDGTASTFAMSAISRLYLDAAEADAIQTLTATGVQEGAAVQIYSPSGALLHTSTYTNGSLNLGNLPQGIYVVKVGGQTFKVSKR